VTIFYAPFLLPLVLPGVSVNPWDIAKSLIVLMLIPLAIGMLVQSSLPEDAAHWQPVMGKISSVALIIMLVVQLGLNIPSIIDMIGSRGFLAMLLFIAGSLLIGYLLGGRQPGVRNVMALGTAMRNVSAAIVVASQNFSNSDTLSFVLVAGLVMLLGLLPAARRMGALRQAIEPKPTG
jgi:BASS family bile acid:Na+ symporter